MSVSSRRIDYSSLVRRAAGQDRLRRDPAYEFSGRSGAFVDSLRGPYAPSLELRVVTPPAVSDPTAPAPSGSLLIMQMGY